MTSFQSIAVIGGTGYLGRVVTERLVAGNFQITVITRNAASAKDVPAGAKVRVADYDSLESLINAFQSFDVVVNTLPGHVEDLTGRVFEAVVAAKVTRYFPSEYGLDHRVPAAQTHVLAGSKIKAHAALSAAAEAGDIEYTSLVGGSWIEFLLNFEGSMSVKTRKFYLHDGGNTTFGMTTRAAFGDAIIGALTNPDATRNKILSIEVIALTQNNILEIFKEAFPKAEFEVIPVATAERTGEAVKRLFSGDANMEIFQTLALQFNFDPEYHPLPAANELLGVKRLNEDEFKEIALSIAKE